jgi:hypothetical protein
VVTRRRALAVLLAAALTDATGAGAEGLTPLEVDWEQIFRLDWKLSGQGGQGLIEGRIYNVSFYGTSRIQLLVDQLDASGRTVSQRLAWLGFSLKPGDSAYFDVSVPARDAAYRVRVYAFDRKFGTTQN